MLLDEDPATLIRECTTNFNLAPDKAALARLNASLHTLGGARASRLGSIRAGLQHTNRRLAALASQHDDARSSRDSGAHAAAILALDRDKFRVAKVAAEAEAEGERLRGELESLRGGLEDGEGGVEAMGGGEGEDEIILKLKVYRSLGIDVEADPATGAYARAVIRNPHRGDVHVVNIDPRFSRYFYANYFWGSV